MRHGRSWSAVLLTPVLAVIVIAAGCGGHSVLEPPTAFSGKLVAGDGAPLGNVLLTLQPLGLGHPVLVQVGADGTFNGEAVAGEYAYFVGPLAKGGAAGAAAIKRVRPEFLEGTLTRTVTVRGSTSLNIVLD